MSDLIDRQAAIDEIYHHFPSLSRSEAAMVLHTVPSADVVEVVRCKKCKYSSVNYGAIVYCCFFKVKVNEEGYCYIGERRTDG